jgi:tetratricopeptide (TPR) repeat protein
MKWRSTGPGVATGAADGRSPRGRSASDALAAGAAAVLLAACTSAPRPPAETPAAPAPEPVVELPVRPGAHALAVFEQQHRQQAAQAAAQGRWADAQAAWDVVLALRPHDEEARARRREAEAAAEAGVAERLPRARQTQQRGDAESASRLYLEVLALDPANAEAADALRAIEFERMRRTRSAVAARDPAYRRPVAPAEPVPAPMPAAGTVRRDVEHASMLSRQGEVDAAIALLQPVATARRADPAARALMADLYVQKADRLAATDRAAAIAALENGLKFAPGHPAATARLRELRQAGRGERKAPLAPPKVP